MKKKICLAMTGILCLSFGVGCSSQQEETTLTPVRLNEVVHSVFYAPQYVAQELGFFEEEGLDVTVAVGNGADKSMTALLSDSADIALLGTEAGIYVYNEGKEDYPKAFAQLTQRAGNFLVSRVDEPDFQWTDLKGKSVIGGRLGGMPELVLEYVIKENSMTIGKDMEIINNIDFSSTAGAFTGNVGDYTVEFEPVATTLEQNGSGYIVASLGEASGYVPYTVYMARDDFMTEHPDVIEAFTRAIYRGQQWVETHTSEEVAEVVLPQFPESDTETLATIIERYKAQDTWKTDPIFSEEGFTLIQDIMEQGGELSQRVPFSDLIRNDFAEKITHE
ncbi:ABC transporter substrate-binding protein [Anaerotignum sp.]